MNHLAKYQHIAFDRAWKIKKFQDKLGKNVVLIGFLFLINLLTFGGSWWVIWPMLGIGLSLAMKAVKIYGLPGSGSRNWEEEKVEKIMHKLEDEEEAWKFRNKRS